MYNELEVTAMEIIKNAMHRGKSFKIHEQSDSDQQDTIKLSTIHIIEIQKERERVDSKKKKKIEKRNGYFFKFDENNIKFGEQYGDPLKNQK